MSNSVQRKPDDEPSARIDSPIMDYLHDLRDQFASIDEGEIAGYIPELAKAIR